MKIFGHYILPNNVEPNKKNSINIDIQTIFLIHNYCRFKNFYSEELFSITMYTVVIFFTIFLMIVRSYLRMSIVNEVKGKTNFIVIYTLSFFGVKSRIMNIPYSLLFYFLPHVRHTDEKTLRNLNL